MRDFLPEIKIVGAMLVSRGGEILYRSIPNLMKWCDWILIMLDNEDKTTRRIAERYKVNYPDRFRLARTNLSRTTKEQEKKNPKIIFKRFKPIQGLVRDKVFKYLHGCVKRGEKIDLILFPDSDEVFSDFLPQLLEEFWAMTDMKAISMKPIDVYGDFKTVRGISMSPHIRILKYSPELTAVPYRSLCRYLPLVREELLCRTRVTVHLAHLTVGKRQWRMKHWRNYAGSKELLYRLDKDVRKMSMPEIRAAQDKEPYMTVGEYLKKKGLTA